MLSEFLSSLLTSPPTSKSTQAQHCSRIGAGSFALPSRSGALPTPLRAWLGEVSTKQYLWQALSILRVPGTLQSLGRCLSGAEPSCTQPSPLWHQELGTGEAPGGRRQLSRAALGSSLCSLGSPASGLLHESLKLFHFSSQAQHHSTAWEATMVPLQAKDQGHQHCSPTLRWHLPDLHQSDPTAQSPTAGPPPNPGGRTSGRSSSKCHFIRERLEGISWGLRSWEAVPCHTSLFVFALWKESVELEGEASAWQKMMVGVSTQQQLCPPTVGKDRLGWKVLRTRWQCQDRRTFT